MQRHLRAWGSQPSNIDFWPCPLQRDFLDSQDLDEAIYNTFTISHWEISFWNYSTISSFSTYCWSLFLFLLLTDCTSVRCSFQSFHFFISLTASTTAWILYSSPGWFCLFLIVTTLSGLSGQSVTTSPVAIDQSALPLSNLWSYSAGCLDLDLSFDPLYDSPALSPGLTSQTRLMTSRSWKRTHTSPSGHFGNTTWPLTTASLLLLLIKVTHSQLLCCCVRRGLSTNLAATLFWQFSQEMTQVIHCHTQ